MVDEKKVPKVEGRARPRRRGNQQRESRKDFKSDVPGLETHTFNIGGSKQAGQFVKTLEEIATYCQKEYSKGGGDIGTAIRSLQNPVLTLPPEPGTPAIPAVPGDPNAVPPIPPQPAVPAVPPTATEVFIWQEEYKRANERIHLFRGNRERATALVWGQCSQELRNKVKAAPTYGAIWANHDVVALLLIIRGFCCSFEDERQGTWALQQAKKKAFCYIQRDDMSNADYYDEFMAIVKGVESYGGEWGQEPGLVRVKLELAGVADPDAPTDAELEEAKSAAREDFLAMMLLSGANNNRFWKLREDLANDYTKGRDNYPSTVDGMLRLLNNYKLPKQRQQQTVDSGGNEDRLAFLQGQGNVLKCWHCDEKGHTKANCPKLKEIEEGTQNLNVEDTPEPEVGIDNLNVHGISLLGAGRNGKKALDILKPSHLLVDSCASYCSTPYRGLLDGVAPQGSGMIGHGNAGSTFMKEAGSIGKLEKVWLNEDGIASILPLSELIKMCRVTFDSEKSDRFTVHTEKGPVELKNNEAGMPYIDLEQADERAALCFVQTIRERFEGYTHREVKEAKAASRAQALIGSPPDREFRRMVSKRLIPNCPITVKSFDDSKSIFGPDLAGVRGRTTRSKPAHVHVEYLSIPRSIVERYQAVELAVDVMFVDEVPFLVSVARGLNLVTAEFTPVRTANNLAANVKHILRMYARGGFRVTTLLMDNEFECLIALLPELIVNTTAAREHVTNIERRIRTMKERGRGTKNTLPYKRFPKLMLIELVNFVVFWLNAFPLKSGISDEYSPRELVLRRSIDFDKHCRVPFGTYVEAHDDPIITNDSEPRTTPAIALGPTGNAQGTHKFLSLITGKKIKRRKWTEYPAVPDSVIKKVHRMADRDGRYGNLAFANRHGDLFAWNDEVDEEYDQLLVERAHPHPDIAAELPGVLREEDLPVTTDPVIDEDEIPGVMERRAAANAGLLEDDTPDMPIIVPANDDELAPPAAEADDDTGIIEVGTVPPAPPAPDAVINIADDASAASQEWFDAPDAEEETPETDAPETDAAQGADTTGADTTGVDPDGDSDDESEASEAYGVRRSARSNKGKSKAKPYDEYLLFSHAKEVNDCKPIPREQWDEFAMGLIFQQYSIKAGLKKFGIKGEKAVTKELKQLHDMVTFFPLDPTKLSKEDRARAIASLMFLKEKRNGEVKGRTCADGRPQRELFEKQDATSPTIATESIFLTALVDALEARNVMCFDIPGAFLHAETDEDVIMVLKGKLAELMVMVDPSLYRKYITIDSKGQAVLYVQMHKALYGMLRSALLFYRKFVSDIEAEGFEINPYDPCVANKIINGKQITVGWHVDDLKVSHEDQKVLDEFGVWLKHKYGDCKEHRGKVHDYLGMELDYSIAGKVRITMIPYLQEMLDEFPEEITQTRTTPAAEYLFKVREDAVKLPEEQAQLFHRFVAKLVFVQARARRDLAVATSFLTTRIKSPDEDDWGKLRRVMQYIKGTLHMPLILSADSMTLPKWWIDAAYAVHEDCKSQTGAMVSFGSGMALSFSRKQKLNVKSSTEAELVGVDDGLPLVLWTRYFLQEQGYEMRPSLVYQDNKSAMLLERNGKASSSKRTKHINVRYFFVKDKIAQREIDLEHCPTEVMWADMLTKPRQGRAWIIFRSMLMGIPEDYNDDQERIARAKAIEARAKADDARALADKNAKTAKPTPTMTPPSPQECVSVHSNKENISPRVNKSRGKRPPLMLVRGRRWSPSIYRNARLAGLATDRAWVEVFVQ